MNKKGTWILWISIAFVLLLIVGIFLYFSLSGPNYDARYAEKISSGELVNPVYALTEEQAVLAFDESFIYYLLYSIKAYNLHSPPLSSDSPKIEIFIGNQTYNVEIEKGVIYVKRGEVVEKDIIIRTNAVEAVNMLKNKDYVQESFLNGNSNIERVASQTTLFGKGYLKMYNELTGKGLTGNVIKIYID